MPGRHFASLYEAVKCTNLRSSLEWKLASAQERFNVVLIGEEYVCCGVTIGHQAISWYDKSRYWNAKWWQCADGTLVDMRSGDHALKLVQKTRTRQTLVRKWCFPQSIAVTFQCRKRILLPTPRADKPCYIWNYIPWHALERSVQTTAGPHIARDKEQGQIVLSFEQFI